MKSFMNEGAPSLWSWEPREPSSMKELHEELHERGSPLPLELGAEGALLDEGGFMKLFMNGSAPEPPELGGLLGSWEPLLSELGASREPRVPLALGASWKALHERLPSRGAGGGGGLGGGGRGDRGDMESPSSLFSLDVFPPLPRQPSEPLGTEALALSG